MAVHKGGGFSPKDYYNALNPGSLGSHMFDNYKGNVGKPPKPQGDYSTIFKPGSSSSKPSGGSSKPTHTQTAPASSLPSLKDQFNAIYQQQQANANKYQQQLQQAAQNSYNNNMNALNAAYGAKLDALANGYNSTKDALGKQYDTSKGEVNRDAERALREAFVNKMMSAKNLQQQLTAQGLSGGAAESTMASLQNNYGNARNGIETTRNDNLTDLNNTFQNNLAAAEREYYNQLAAAADQKTQLEIQIENALANALMGSYESQINALKNADEAYYGFMGDLIGKQMDYEFRNAKAGNPAAVITSLAQNDMGTYTDKAKYDAMFNRASELHTAGHSDESIMNQLFQAGASQQMITDILNQMERER